MGIRSEQGSRDSREPRGQTTLDFVIGISVFLAVLLFIFLFLPGILAPFTTSAQAETVSSNRVADQLATGTLASPAEPYVLDRFCTVEFFDGNAPGQCNYGSGSLAEQVGVASANQNVNVTLRGNLTTAGTGNDILCWDAAAPDSGLVETGDAACDPSGDDVVLTRGADAPGSQSSVTSLRVVALDGTDATLYVEMW